MTISFLSRALPAALFVALISCGNNNSQQATSATTVSPGDTATHRVDTVDRSRPPRNNDNGMAVNAHEKIQGEWVDESDPMSVLIFTADKQISIYDGKSIDTLGYEVTGINCAPGKPDQSPDGGLYLKTDQCYAIRNIDEKTLTLIYLDRGNTLVYKRRK